MNPAGVVLVINLAAAIGATFGIAAGVAIGMFLEGRREDRARARWLRERAQQ
jgi:hypothetical protein